MDSEKVNGGKVNISQMEEEDINSEQIVQLCNENILEILDGFKTVLEEQGISKATVLEFKLALLEDSNLPENREEIMLRESVHCYHPPAHPTDWICE